MYYLQQQHTQAQIKGYFQINTMHQDFVQIFQTNQSSIHFSINDDQYERTLENPKFTNLLVDEKIEEELHTDLILQIFNQHEEGTKSKYQENSSEQIQNLDSPNSLHQFQVETRQENNVRRFQAEDSKNLQVLKKKRIKKKDTWVSRDQMIKDAQKNTIQFFSGKFYEFLVKKENCQLSKQEISAIKYVKQNPTIKNMNDLFQMGGRLRLELAKLFLGNNLWAKIQSSKIRNLYSKIVYRDKIDVLRNAFYKQNLKMLSTSL